MADRSSGWETGSTKRTEVPEFLSSQSSLRLDSQSIDHLLYAFGLAREA